MIFQLLFQTHLEAFESFSGFIQYLFDFSLRAMLNEDTMNPKLIGDAFSLLAKQFNFNTQ